MPAALSGMRVIGLLAVLAARDRDQVDRSYGRQKSPLGSKSGSKRKIKREIH
jgi:hypothetical protein